MASHWRRTLLLTSALVPLAVASAMAGPNGATVVGGAANIQGQGTANVIINQSTQNAIINWNTFNIGAGEKTTINMPSPASAELDRVTGGLGPSQILGSLSSNGRVFLVNPDGFLFGAGSTVNVGGLLATTHDITNSDFMAGRYNFAISGSPYASIVNEGSITAQTGGFAALVAPGVRNTGTISAKLGTIALASGNGFTLDLYGDNLITLGVTDSIASQVIDVSTGKPLSSLVSNAGKLTANGGRVELTAVAAREIVDSVINNSGVIEANTIGTHNGMIVLGAATGANKPAGAPVQTVRVSGTLSAAGRRKGTKGGTIQVTGENIQVSGAAIDASGRNGGGTVLIGGDWGGGNPNTSLVSNQSAYLQPYAVPLANTVSIDAATTIDASAMNVGNGGKVIVWSNDATTFYGTILAEGGASSGNGGFVETSGHELTFKGTVNTTAPNGATGLWLLDPYDLTIDSVAASTISDNLANSNVTIETTATGYSGSGNATSGEGDIIIDAPLSWSSSSTLTLDAYNAIVINAEINVMSAGHVVLAAANNPLAPAAPLISFGNGGSVQFTGTPSSGQSLTINNQTYTLLYTISDMENINLNLGGYYALARSLDATALPSWTPIGSEFPNNPFTGTFNGLGNAISEVTIIGPTSNVYDPLTNPTGLFANSAGVISNIHLLNGTVTGVGPYGFGLLVGSNTGTITNSDATGIVNAGGQTGGLVGWNGGNVSNSYAKVTVTGDSSVGGLIGYNNGGTISNSYATGNVSGNGEVGGLVGSFRGGTLTRSYATGSVVGVSYVGGLVGENDAIILQSFATGPVIANGSPYGYYIGGLVGNNDGSISESYATGSVTVTNGYYDVGGLVGYNWVPVGYSPVGFVPGTITQSYASGLIMVAAGSFSIGGLVGNNGGDCNGCGFGTVSQSYWDMQATGQTGSAGGAGLTTGQLTAQLPSGFDSAVWTIIPNQSYPYFPWQPTSTIPYASATPTPSPNGPNNPNVACAVCALQNQAVNEAATFWKTLLTGGETDLQKGEQLIGSLLSGQKQSTHELAWDASTGLYVPTINGQAIAIPPQRESLSLLDCEATVFAMVGNVLTVLAGNTPTFTGANNPYENANGVANPDPSGAPPIKLVGGEPTILDVAANNVVGYALNTALFSRSPSLTKLTSFPAIIGGTIVGVKTKETIPHFMLAVGIDPTTKYIVANDPNTGEQVEINPNSGTVVGIVGQGGKIVTYTSDQNFQAVGFVGIQL